MSYDLHLFKADGLEGDLLGAAQASLERDSEELNPGPIDAAAEERKQRLAQARQSVNPALEVFVFDYADIARIEGTTESEARRRWRHLELNGPEEGNGIQITLSDTTAELTVPYWHRAAQAESVWREIWRYLEVFRAVGGYTIYDPQLDRLLDPSADLPAVLETYAVGVGATHEAAVNAIQPKKPWWKLW